MNNRSDLSILNVHQVSLNTLHTGRKTMFDTYRYTASDIEKSMIDSKLPPRQPLIPDGKIHRFHISGDRPENKRGWYVLHTVGQTLAYWGSYINGEIYSLSDNEAHELNPQTRRQQNERITAIEDAKELLSIIVRAEEAYAIQKDMFECQKCT